MSNHRQIKIYSDTEKGCIFFDGSPVEPKFIGTIIVSAHPTLDNRIVIKRTDRLRDDGISFRVLFRKLKIGRIQNREGQDLVDELGMNREQIVDYLNQQANDFQATTATRPSLTDHPNFDLDPTSTSILVDNGEHFGVNTIKAVLGEDGLIDIVSSDFSSNSVTYFADCPPENIKVKGEFPAGGPADIVNKLNELFTVGAFESVVVSDPYSTMVADVNGTEAGYTLEGNDAIDPEGGDIFTYDGSGYPNYAGLKSVATIDQAGEYFTFDIRGEGTIGFGLVHTQDSYDAGRFSGNSSYADPTTFATVNSAHYGFQFSHWFHPTPNGSWTNYGANTSFSIRSGWNNFNGTPEQADWLAGNPIKIKCGIDENGFISIATLRNGTDWVVHARSGYPVPEGGVYHLGIKSQSTAARVFSAPKVHLLEPQAPTMYFRYIESPDGNFEYPLFATAEEANYYDENHDGTTGTGTSHQHVYADDPTNTTWFMPDTGRIMNGSTPPQDVAHTVFQGNTVTYTEITSLSNSDLLPSSFSGSLTVDELDSVNYQTQPQDTGYSTSISGLPAGLTDIGYGMVGGTAPEVTGDNVANPSDTYAATVTRTNSYGSSTGTLNITVNNLTPPATLPSGFSQTSGGLNPDGTLASDSVVTLDDTLASGKRMIVNKSWVESNVLPYTDDNLEKAYIGIPASNANWSTVGLHDDFDAVMRWEGKSNAQHNSSLADGSDAVNRQESSVGSDTDAVFHYAIQWDGTDLVVMRDQDINKISTEHDFTQMQGYSAYESYSEQSGALPIVMATKTGGSIDLGLTGISFIDIPDAPVTNLTPWNKALDFSGSSERAVQVSTSSGVNPIMMTGLSRTTSVASAGNTSSDGYSRPWATACVFKYDGNNSNQHIWNAGEGSSGDNIYLRISATGYLYFGWGRSGSPSEINECSLGGSLSTEKWFGVYIGHNGTRLSAGDATAANLAQCFDIYLMRLNDAGTAWTTRIGTLTDAEGNRSIASNWYQSGSRMDRATTGQLSIGGRGSNRSFHGKVASMVVTTLRRGQPMPIKEEAEMMITDPKQWEDVYRVGQVVRNGNGGSTSTYNPSSVVSGYGCTQMWLMGDGTNDSYSNMIRNQVYPQDQNYTKLNLISMVSNDIQNVTIPGLSS